MPELPEVETVAADLRDQLVGRRFTGAEIVWPWTLAQPDAAASLAERLAGREVVHVGRRGKYLLIALDSGAMLIIHLRMTGQARRGARWGLGLGGQTSALPVSLADGALLVFTDMRKFGRIWLVDDVQEVVGKLGPEPWIGPSPLRF